jgi:hypothetical protein
MSIDQTVEELETITRHFEAGRIEAAREATRQALTAAVEQQRRHWQYWEDRQRQELAAQALANSAQLYTEVSEQECPF